MAYVLKINFFTYNWSKDLRFLEPVIMIDDRVTYLKSLELAVTVVSYFSLIDTIFLQEKYDYGLNI